MDDELCHEKVAEFNAIPILDVAEMLGIDIKPQGKTYDILCPNPTHDDHHLGSCKLDPGKNMCICYACGFRAKPIDLVKTVMNVSFMEACNWLSITFGIEKFDPKQGDNTPAVLSIAQEKSLGLSAAKYYTEDGKEHIYSLSQFFADDPTGFYYIVCGKLRERLMSLIPYYMEFPWIGRKEFAPEIKSMIEDSINTLLPLAYRYKGQGIAGTMFGETWNWDFLSQYHEQVGLQSSSSHLLLVE